MSKSKALRLELEKKATSFRKENGYSSTEPIRLASLLMKRNVISLFKPLSGSLSGMSIKSGSDLRFMMINQNHVIGKQHFTIAHELYHLFIQDNFTSQRCITGLFDSQLDIEERKADIFAACFLMPQEGILEMIPDKEFAKKTSVSPETIFKIQHYFSVSMKSVIFRLVELDLVDKSYFDDYANGIKKTAQRLGYDLSLYEPGNNGKTLGDYGTLANQLFKSNKISESHFFELMNAINVDPLATTDGDNE